jgi:hypothetical protein
VAGGSASRGGGAPEVRRSGQQAGEMRLNEAKLLVWSICSGRRRPRRIGDGSALDGSISMAPAAAQGTARAAARAGQRRNSAGGAPHRAL